MNIESIKRKFPVLYQLYLCAKDRKYLEDNRKQSKLIHNMNQGQIENYLADLYEKWIGHKLDWNNLRTWTEKMQWEKIYDDDPRKIICADKYAVRQWVADRIGEEYLIPLIGIWDKYEQINFKTLPEKFVMKTNHGSGDVVIIRNKSAMSLADKIGLKRKMQTALQTDFGAVLGELHYSLIPPKIIAEEIIGKEGQDLRDYKFLCFNGKAYYCCVDFDRFTKHKRNVYDLNWNLQSWNTGDYDNYLENFPKPKNFEKMIELVECLAKDFYHVRVDFYNVDGKIYFGEMTFTSASGLHKFTTGESDLALGELWRIDTSKRRSSYLKLLK